MRRLLLTFILSGLTAFGGDLTGKWLATVETDAGNGTPTFVLKQVGEKITGHYSGALGEAEVTGTVKGNDVTIQFEVDGNAIVYAAKLKGEKKMKGTVKLGELGSGTFTAEKE
jgi:hypothetical protein